MHTTLYILIVLHFNCKFMRIFVKIYACATSLASVTRIARPATSMLREGMLKNNMLGECENKIQSTFFDLTRQGALCAKKDVCRF